MTLAAGEVDFHLLTFPQYTLDICGTINVSFILKQKNMKKTIVLLTFLLGISCIGMTQFYASLGVGAMLDSTRIRVHPLGTIHLGYHIADPDKVSPFHGDVEYYQSFNIDRVNPVYFSMRIGVGINVGDVLITGLYGPAFRYGDADNKAKGIPSNTTNYFVSSSGLRITWNHIALEVDKTEFMQGSISYTTLF